MTEQEWLTSTDPAAMLDWCNSERDYRPSVHPVVTDRQLRLFACACCRQVWHLLTDKRSRRAVEVAERYADGLEISMALRFACEEAGRVLPLGKSNPAASMAAWVAYWELDRVVRQVVSWDTKNTIAQASLIRCIIGNPFRPVRVKVHPCIGTSDISIHDWESWLAWQDETIPALAQAAYEERVVRTCPKCHGQGGSHSGQEDFWYDCTNCHGTGYLDTGELDAGRLAMLADALEEAGCQEEVILRHLRSLEPHVRGCWVIDTLTGRS